MSRFNRLSRVSTWTLKSNLCLQELSSEKDMKPENVTSLDISNNQVSLLPQALAQLVNLTKLAAAKNEIKNIPFALGRLNELRSI